MGHLIRFIHNRDLAAENIMTAACRQRALLNSPPVYAERLLRRAESRSINLPENSTLKLILKPNPGIRPGNTEVVAQPSRRNSKKLRLTPDFLNAAKGVYKELKEHRSWEVTGVQHTTLTSGIHTYRCISLYIGFIRCIPLHTNISTGLQLFGREFQQGCTVEYAPVLRPRHNLPGPGGLSGVTESLRLGTVHMVYILTMTGTGPETCIFWSKFRTFPSWP